MIDVKKIWLTDAAVWIETADGRQACEKFENYASLRNASVKERQAYTRSPFGLHWPALDEDLSFEGFFASKEHNTYLATHAVALPLSSLADVKQQGQAQVCANG